MKILILVISGLLIFWIIWSFFADGNLETPKYSILETKSGYEIRDYESYVIAKTTVSAGPNATNQAFSEIAGYIFGGNSSNEKIAMTAPVSTEKTSTKIAMTAPVSTSEDQGALTMSFMMPSKFDLENLPTPNSEKISFKEVPSATYAVLSFTGLTTKTQRETKTAKLMVFLERDNITSAGPAELLQYDRPFKFPWFRKNEIKIKISE